MRQVSSWWQTALLCITMLYKVQCFPERTISNKNESATVPVIWNTHQSPYVNVTGVLSNGNDSMIVRTGSQLDLWRLEDESYVFQKSCQLEEGINNPDVLPNSNILCYINNNFTLILYDLTTCRVLFRKDSDDYLIFNVKTTKDHVLAQTHEGSAQLFNWNGSNLNPVVTFSRFFCEIHLSRNGVVAYRKGSCTEDCYASQQLRHFHTTTRHSIKMGTGFVFGSYRLSPDGRYAVLSSEDWEYVAVHNLETNRLVFNGSVEHSGSVERVLLEDDRLYIVFSNRYIEMNDMTIAYIDISADLEDLDNRFLTFTTIDLDVPSVFAENVEFRRINGTSYLQFISSRGELNFFKLDKNGQTWVPLL